VKFVTRAFIIYGGFFKLRNSEFHFKASKIVLISSYSLVSD